jgi:hypothetical protein
MGSQLRQRRRQRRPDMVGAGAVDHHAQGCRLTWQEPARSIITRKGVECRSAYVRLYSGWR